MRDDVTHPGGPVGLVWVQVIGGDDSGYAAHVR
jgi:hypothetical protein